MNMINFIFRKNRWTLVLIGVLFGSSLLLGFQALQAENVVSDVNALSASNNLEDKVGVCTSINQVTLLEKATCAFIEIGIRDFFIPEKSDAEFEINLKKAKDSALPVYAGNSFYPGEMKLVGSDLNIQQVLDYTDIIMRRAKQAGTKILVLGSGGARRIPDQLNYEVAEKQFIDLCKKIANLGQKYDVIVVIEPLRKQETNFINTVREGMKIVRAVNHPNLKVLADFYHMACEGEDPGAIIEAGADLYHCHIAEVAERTAPGIKGDDFTPYFRALKRINYKGYISLECRWGEFENEVISGVKETKKQIVTLNHK